MSGNRENADDLFQETLMKAWKFFPKNPDMLKINSWLFSIAHNVIIDYYRKIKPDINFIEETFSASMQDLPDENLIGTETGKQIEEIVKKLPLKQKRALVLRINGGLKYKEIAEIMNEPLNTVLSHINYALKKIRKELEENNAA